MSGENFRIVKQPEESGLFMDELLAELRPGADVLDLGCGGGSFAYTLFDLRIVAYDQHQPPNLAEFPAHVTFKQGAIEELPFAAESFDLVISNFVYEHVTNLGRCIEQAERVLRPGGLFYASIPRAASLEDRVYRRLFNDQGGHRQRFSFESFVRQVYQCSGFKLLSYADWPGGYTYLRGHQRLRAAIYWVIGLVRAVIGKNLLGRNNFILLFRKDGGHGWRTVTHCCSQCGGGSALPVSFDEARWTCPHCQALNPYVKP